MGEVAVATVSPRREACCSLYHHAVELVGKRWTGAILFVLLEGPARFSEIKECVPDLSDRLRSERLNELEGQGIGGGEGRGGIPGGGRYALTRKGGALGPTVDALKSWARSYLD